MSVRWLCYRILAAGPLAACSSNSSPSTAATGRVPTADPKRSPHAGRRGKITQQNFASGGTQRQYTTKKNSK